MDAAKERFRLSKFPHLENDPSGKVGNVLLSDEIRALCTSETRMIDPYEEANVRAASYRLRVGEQFRQHNVISRLESPGVKDAMHSIRIAPGEMVVIQTLETLNLPRSVIARWNLKVDLVYKGLLWVGGPQVDPGWLGHLQCPIYNLSNETVTLEYGDGFAIMDFQRTTPFDPKTCVAYQRPPARVTMEEYLYSTVPTSSGDISAIRGIGQDMEQLRSEVKVTKLEQDKERSDLLATSAAAREEVNLLRQSIFTVMGVFVAAVGALVTAVAVFVSKSGPYVQPSWFLPIAVFAIFGSLLASVYALVRTRLLGAKIEGLIAKRTTSELPPRKSPPPG
jgi:deoxycytidine triphosphate deaminase